jgi:NAD(P)H-dependent FMN reductase
MKKIIAFGASNSTTSINQQLAVYAASQFEHTTVEVLNLNDYEMPIYSMEREKTAGIPDLAKDFFQKIGSADILVISLAEHNGSYSTAFKNIFDWMSRFNGKVFQDKPLLLLSTSPGPRGGITVLNAALERWTFMGANIKGSLSLPEFYKNFDAEKGITSEVLKADLLKAIAAFSA